MKHRPLAAALVLPLAACASFVTGPEDTVTVASVPPGAYFTTSAGPSGYTPMAIRVPDSHDLVVEYRKPGFEPLTVVLERRLSRWIVGSLLLGGPIGVAVDLLHPDSRTHDGVVTATLVELAGGRAGDGGARIEAPVEGERGCR